MTFFQTLAILIALFLGFYASALLTIISARLLLVINTLKAIGVIEMARAGVELKREAVNVPTAGDDPTKH